MVKNKMITLIRYSAILVFIIQSMPAFASEEDLAYIKRIELDARTTCEPFGIVTVQTKQKDNEIGLEYFRLTYGGKVISIPIEELQKIEQVDLASLRVSCEIGYPDRGYGPSLYVVIKSANWKIKYRCIFTKEGFKEFKKESD